jgi:SAM-dependent methyltransferase
MMTKKLHAKIARQFRGRVYHNWGAIKKKVAHLRKFLKLFKGTHVLEVGYNAGMASFDVADTAASYVGIEAKENYYKQAKITKKYLKSKNAKYLNRRFEEFINSGEADFDTLYASYVLYHLDNDEVKLLRDTVLPKCKLVFIYSRNEKRKKLNNKYRLEDEKNIVKLLKDFKTKVHYDNQKAFFCVIGRRDNGQGSKTQGPTETDQAGERSGNTEGRGALDK